MRNYISILTLVALFTLRLAAQDDPNKFLPNIMPPSPTSYELGKYGNQPIGLVTGSTNISIPLYTYKSKSLTTPINLFYSKNGIKVDETSGMVGLGWNLSMGGVVNRTIRDLPDNVGLTIPGDAVFEEGINPEKYLFYEVLAGANVDSEPDLFSFNFNGNSGQFIIYKDEVLMLKESTIKIAFELYQNRKGFNATTPDGVTYYFYEPEKTSVRSYGGAHSYPETNITSWYLTKIHHPNGEEITFTYEDFFYEYDASKYQVLTYSLNEVTPCNTQPFAPSFPPYLSNIYTQNHSIQAKRLISIQSANIFDGQVTFEYDQEDTDVMAFNKLTKIKVEQELNGASTVIEEIAFTYETNSNGRIFLKDVHYLDPDKKYTFSYLNMNGTPPRLSLAQDKWGYFNGAIQNTSIIPSGIKGYGLENLTYGGANKELNFTHATKGMIEKIVYPTKGYTTFEYECNNFYGERLPDPIMTYFRLETETPQTETHSQTFNSLSDQTVRITGRSRFNDEDCNSSQNNGHQSSTLSVMDLTTQQPAVVFIYNSAGVMVPQTSTIFPSNGVTKTYYFNAIEGHTYSVELLSIANCTVAHCDVHYNSIAMIPYMTNIDTGGLRVSKTIDYNNDNTVANQKKYFYSKSFEELSISSGRPFKLNPDLFDIEKVEIECGTSGNQSGGSAISPQVFKKGKVTSTSLGYLFDNEGSNIYYSNVTESFGGDSFENGAIEHRYEIKKNIPGNLVKGDAIRSCPTVNSAWQNGKETSTITYAKRNNDLVRIAERNFSYTLDETTNKKVTAFSCRKDYTKLQQSSSVHYCTASQVSSPCNIVGYECLNTHHSHTHAFFTAWSRCKAPNSQNVPIQVCGPCNQHQVGDIIYFPSNLDNLSIMSYEIRSNWSYLERLRELQYDQDGNNPVEKTTTYAYNNRNHLQLSSETTTSSTGEMIESKYYYPFDVAVSSEPFVNDLISRNMVSSPLKTESYRDGIKLSEQKTIYAQDSSTEGLLLPKYVKAAKFPNPPPPNPDVLLETKITYDKYDTQGNILQYSIEDGRPVSLVWGYNNSLPIAKVENAVYSSLSHSLLTLYKAASNGSDDNALRMAATALRETGIPGTAMMTSYTFKPLIGITSVIDPKGSVQYYVYDILGRLKYVKNDHENVVSSNEYHYKN